MATVAEREELLGRLRAAGADDATIQAARSNGRLATLAVELELGGRPAHTLTAVARVSGLDPRFLRALLRAHGRPDPVPRERAYTDQDVELARLVKRFLDAGLPRDGVLEVARVMGQGMSQTADVIRRMVADAVLQPGDSELSAGLRYAQAAEQLTPLVAPLLDYQFRAHLREAVQRELITEAEREAGRLAGSRDVAVAFADLVGYTKLGESLAVEDVGRIATRLAELAAAAVRRPAQLVKTIGDAAMFVSGDVDALVGTAVRLTELVEQEGEQFPAVRIGIAYGPATARGGDWFGATVNVASRVTDAAKPGRIVVTGEVAAHAGSDHVLKRRRKRSLKGVESRTRLFSVEPPTPPSPGR